MSNSKASWVKTHPFLITLMVMRNIATSFSCTTFVGFMFIMLPSGVEIGTGA